MRFSLSAGVVGAVMGIVVLAASPPAYAASTVRPTTPSTTTTITTGAGTASGKRTATPGAGGEKMLSPAELADQIAAAKALVDDLTQSNAGIAAATTQLERLSIQANGMLQAYATARDAERAAREEANRNVLLYQQRATQLGEDRKALVQWAYQVYAGGGGSLGDMSALLDSLTSSAAAATDTAAQLGYLSDQRARAFERVRDVAQLQRDVAARAVEASTRATEAAQQAADAKSKLDAVIVEHRAQLEATRALHAAQVARVHPIKGLLLGSGDAAAINAARRLSKAVLVPGVARDGSVKACSTDEKEYPNGRIPAAALCPLYGDPAQSLRPAAAAAFSAMSLAYQRDTGAPICITDSYRSFAEQLSVKAARGVWAATPGTSEHGMGRALDLCGGIQSFGSPAYLWMKQNAPLYGWFHPDWAEPSGPLPEPWHWEHAG